MSTYPGSLELAFAVGTPAPTFGTYTGAFDLAFGVDSPPAVFFGALDLAFAVETPLRSVVFVKAEGMIQEMPLLVFAGGELIDPVTGEPPL